MNEKQSKATPGRAKRRSPQDYAIEHAEYMANAAECFMEATSDLAMAHQLMEAGMVDESDVDAARETVGEAHGALRNCIYEFRKRHARAAITKATQGA